MANFSMRSDDRQPEERTEKQPSQDNLPNNYGESAFEPKNRDNTRIKIGCCVGIVALLVFGGGCWLIGCDTLMSAGQCEIFRDVRSAVYKGRLDPDVEDTLVHKIEVVRDEVNATPLGLVEWGECWEDLEPIIEDNLVDDREAVVLERLLDEIGKKRNLNFEEE